MPARSSIVFFPVESLEAARSFYETTLGFELVLDQGACLIFRVGDSGFWGFCEATNAVEPDQRMMLTVVDEDVEGWHERLTAAGIETDGPPRENPRFQIFHFFAADPSGYKLEFQRFLDPRWRD